ncbi:MAG: hypothetical protein KDD37_07325 [Bdellovibrionales bacterium]|nr:hypothetical protein [Bdellovibrionales bacterium]
MSVKSILLIVISLTAKEVIADTALPYIGPENANCKVTQSSMEYDAGYESSEDCEVIYVKPPVIGKVITRDPFSLREAELLCPSIDKLYVHVAELIDEQSQLDPIKNIQRIKELAKQIKLTRESIEAISGNNPVSHVSAAASLGWTDLVREYKKLNPSKTVRPLPITTGLFTTKVYATTNLGRFSDAGVPGVTNLSVNGITIPEDAGTIDDMAIPSIVEKLTTADGSSTVFMGEAVGMSLTLNLNGACALLNQNQAGGLLGGTYTYFYPLQTKASYKVKLNEVLFEKAIFDLVAKKQRVISLDEAIAATKNIKAIDIDIINDFFPDSEEGKRLESEYKDEINAVAVQTILSSISEKTSIAIEVSRYNQAETRYSVSCHRRWFRKVCHTSAYTVNVPKINWDNVKKELGEMIGGGEAGVNSYRSLYMMSTSAILPAKDEK